MPRIEASPYYRTAFAAGVLGALAMTVIMAGYRAAGLPIVQIERALGLVLIGHDGPFAWILGFIWHMINGGIFAVIYAAGFRVLGRASAGIGALFGFVHWCVAGFLLGILPIWRIPGFFLVAPSASALYVRYGGLSTVVVFGLHLLYGLIVGSVCGGVIRENRRSDQENRETRETENARRRAGEKGAA